MSEQDLFILFNDDILKKVEIDLKTFLDSLYNDLDIDKYMVKDLRFCPECIKHGYHSTFHQLNFLDHCILHNVKLKDICPNCQTHLKYIFDYKNNESAFTCNCGYNLLDIQNQKKLFNIWRCNNIDLDKYNNFILPIINTQNMSYMFTCFEYFVNKEILKNKDYYIKNISKFYNVLDNNSYHYKFKPSFKHTMAPSINDEQKINIYDKYGLVIMDSYFSIFKAIARNIRRKYIDSKRIKFYKYKKIYLLSSPIFSGNPQFTNGICFKDIDENLYAYIMWRKEIEGHDNYTDIHTHIANTINYDSFYSVIRYNISNTEIYRYIHSEIDQYRLICKHNMNPPFKDYGILISSLERIICTILIERYYDWVKFAKYMKKEYSNELIDFTIEIPFRVTSFMILWDEIIKMGYLVKVKSK